MTALIWIAAALWVLSAAPPRAGPGSAPSGEAAAKAAAHRRSGGRIFGLPIPAAWRASASSRKVSATTARDIDVFAACLQAGLSPGTAAGAVARISPSPCWGRASALLNLGVDTALALEELRAEPGLEELAALVGLSRDSGAAVAEGCARMSRQLRETLAADAVARAERAGVLISLPLTVCFLPAFIVLGLVPIIVGLGAQML